MKGDYHGARSAFKAVGCYSISLVKKWKFKRIRSVCVAMQVGGSEVKAQTQSSLCLKFSLFSLHSVSSAQKMRTHLSNSLAEEFGPYLSILGAT